jgi:hypothetical protein
MRRIRILLLLTLTLLLLGIGVITVAKKSDLLITRSGEYSSGDKKTWLKVSNSSDGHVALEIAFKINMQVPGMGPNTEVTESRRFADWVEEQARWACCISEAGDVWLYDGGGTFTLFRRKADGIQKLATCSEADLGERAPEVMKRWIARQLAEQDGPANRSQPVGPQTNGASSVAGSHR